MINSNNNDNNNIIIIIIIIIIVIIMIMARIIQKVLDMKWKKKPQYQRQPVGVCYCSIFIRK